jgi:hypothetical protein
MPYFSSSIGPSLSGSNRPNAFSNTGLSSSSLVERPVLQNSGKGPEASPKFRIDSQNGAVLASPNHSVELRMSRSPSFVPPDDDRDVCLVLDDFGGRLGRAWRETKEKIPSAPS